MNDLVFYVYAVSVMVEMIVLECVIRQVDHDWLNNKDPEWVKWARRSTFLAGQVYLVITVVCAWFSVWSLWLVVGLVWAGTFILGVNIVSLYLRGPTITGGYRAFVGYVVVPLRRVMGVFRPGRRLSK